MKQKFDVVALGELLIDFTQNGLSSQAPLYEANPGGAPCNVLSMLKKPGRSCTFIGRAGNDMFGVQLRRVAEEAGTCMDGLSVDPKVGTTPAFVRTAGLSSPLIPIYALLSCPQSVYRPCPAPSFSLPEKERGRPARSRWW